MLVAEKLLPQPLLYLSAFFERYRSEYYDTLLGVSQRGDWMGWLCFFLRGVSTQAVDALNRAHRLQSLTRQYRERMQQKRSSAALLRLVDQLFVAPAVTTKWAAKMLHVTPAAAQRMINKLQQAAILREATGRQRGRIYFADEIVRTLEEPEVEQLQLQL